VLCSQGFGVSGTALPINMSCLEVVCAASKMALLFVLSHLYCLRTIFVLLDTEIYYTLMSYRVSGVFRIVGFF
jgi:hypothetical protein